ncbi:MAG: electron transport complex subunit RsxC [Candidatus Eisenbacteria bacterium]|nr:electron transport complex subunit RsxC [Candidatus Eisenbacteria bacterium]
MQQLKPLPRDLTQGARSFPGGVHPSEHKEITEALAIERLALPSQIILPLAMHAGAPARPTVGKKDEVARAQRVGEASGFVSAPVHSPVFGTVSDVTAVPHQSGRMVRAILIRTDIERTQEAIEAEAEQRVDADLDLSPYEPRKITEAAKEGGLVGLGGAAFPTYIKLTRIEKKPTDIALLNGSECEPYLTADHRMMLEQPGAILAGLRLAMKATGASRGAIGIEDNKPDALRTMRQALSAAGVPEPIDIVALKTKYPQGGERSLIPAITGRAVPVGGFPPDAGVAILNVGTAAALAYAVAHGRPLIERVLTLTGPGIAQPGNLLVPIGTPIRHLVEQRGGPTEDAARVILGGPMMGPAAAQLDLPVMKGMSGITILTEAQTRPRKEVACIRCGRCVDVCPSGLMPATLARLVIKRRIAEARDQHLLACVECGSCAYICPSHIPLVQYLRSGKALVRALPKES